MRRAGLSCGSSLTLGKKEMTRALQISIAVATALSLLGCDLMSPPTTVIASDDMILDTAASQFVAGRRWDSTTLCVEVTGEPQSAAFAKRLRGMHPTVNIKSAYECELRDLIPYDHQTGKPCAALSARVVEKSATTARVQIGYVSRSGGSEEEFAKLVFERGAWKVTEVIEGTIP
jgi:hypothetical protein